MIDGPYGLGLRSVLLSLLSVSSAKEKHESERQIAPS